MVMAMALPHLPLLSRVVPASALPESASRASAWNLADLAGRLVELSGAAEAAHLTAAFSLVLDAQINGDSAAWVTLENSSFFPPDVADSGVDIDALPVVRASNVRTAGRAADHLVRSGGFGLVIVDLSSGIETESERSEEKIPLPLLTRLLGLARQQNVAVLFLTRKSEEKSSLHSLISLRAEARWQRRDEQFELIVCALRDKHGGERWTHREARRGPAGLR
jgi:recombination protein RecA